MHSVTGQVFGATPTQYSHNHFAYLLFTTGAVGLIIFLGLWLSIFRNVSAHLASERDEPAILVPVRLAILTVSANLLIASITTPQFQEMQWTLIFGVMLGLSIDAPTPGLRSGAVPTPGGAVPVFVS